MGRATWVAGRVIAALSVGVLAVISACSDEREPAISAPTHRVTTLSFGKHAAGRRGEQLFRDIAEQAPSFAGFFVDSLGRTNVVVVDSAAEGNVATAAVRATLRREAHSAKESNIANGPIIVKRGQFTFAQLATWRDWVVDNVRSEHNVLWDDVDEVQNRVALGLTRGASDAARQSILTSLVAAGIPSEQSESTLQKMQRIV